MAWDLGAPVRDGYHVAGADLSTAQYCLVALNSTNGVILSTAAGARCYGVLQSPTTSGGLCDIVTLGYTKMAHDGTLTPGLYFGAQGTGGLGTGTSSGTNLNRLGIVATAPSTASGTLCTVLVVPCGLSS